MNRKQIGKNLRNAREAAGLTRDQVSGNENISCSRTTLQQWENGVTEASLEVIGALAELYNVTPQYLIFGNENNSLENDNAAEPMPKSSAALNRGVDNKQFTGRENLGQLLTQARLSASMTRDDVVNNSKTGFSRSSLQAWEAGEREPKLDNLYDLANLYGVHPWQLLSGEDLPSTDNIEAQSDTIDDDYVYIPAYDIEVSAGHGSVCFTDAEPHKHLAFRQRWITARGLQADALAALFTRGDSMTPTIPEGAAVIIDQSRNQALDGKVYVIRIDDRHYVKRTQWLIGGGLRLISDNKLYDPLDITKADMAANNIQICGQVIHASYDLPD